MTDPLAKFRQISQSSTPDQITGEPHRYEAYRSGDRSQERLEIRRVLGATHAPSYRYLMNVSFNGSQGTELVLNYSFMIVKIKGRHMQSLIHAVVDGTCVFVQDYHKNEFVPPLPDAVLIESIEIVDGKEEPGAVGKERESLP